MKKFTCVLMFFALVLSCLPIHASATEVYVYELPDGQTIEYLLDDNMNPYCYDNGEKTYLALPLEHLKVSDENILSELKAMVDLPITSVERAVNFNYVDLSNVTNSTLASSKHSTTVKFDGAQYVTSKFYKFHTNHTKVRLNTTNMKKVSVLDNKKISFTYYYYCEYTDDWRYMYFSEELCTSDSGFPIQQIFDTYQYGYFYFWNDGNLVSYTANVWTTMV